MDDLTSVAATFGVASSDVALAFSVGVAVVTSTTEANIQSGAGINAATVSAGGDITVKASGTFDMTFISGGVAASGSSASVGLASSVLVHGDTVQALIGDHASIATGGVRGLWVDAFSHENVLDLAVAAAVSGGSVGVGGSVLVSVMAETTRAGIGDFVDIASWNNADGINPGVFVEAEAHSTMLSAAGAVALSGGSTGIGAGVNVHDLTKTTEALIGDDVTIAGAPGVAGDVADGNIEVDARTGQYEIGSRESATGVNIDAFKFDGGARPTADDFEVGLPETETPTDLATEADPTDDDSGKPREKPAEDELSEAPDLTRERTAALTETATRGVVVSASGKDDVEAYAIGLAGGGTFGVGVGAAVSVITTTTTADIGANTGVNTDSGVGHSGQSVFVVAASDFSHVGVGAGGAIGGTVGVAPGVDVSVVTQTTAATIGAGADVSAADDVIVSAVAKEKFFVVGAGIAGGGTVAIGGGIAVVTVSNTTSALIGAGATVAAGGDIGVIAEDDTDFTMITFGGGVGIAATGIGAGLGVVVVTKDTTATIAEDTEVDARGVGTGVSGILTGDVTDEGEFATGTAHGVIVQARSSEGLLNLAFAGGGGLVGLAGAVSVTVIDSDTYAVIGENAQINRGIGDFTDEDHIVGAQQGVWVMAANRFSLVSAAGGVAVGFVGAGAAINFGGVRNDVGALIGSGADVRAKARVEVAALSEKELGGYVVMGTGGLVGVGAAVNVFAIGADFDATYTDDDNTSDAAMLDGQSLTGYASDEAGSSTSNTDDSLDALIAEGNTWDTASADGRAAGILGQAKLNKGFNLDDDLSHTPVPEEGVTAVIAGSTSVVTGGDVEVVAHERILVDFITGSGAVGAGAFGAGVTVLTVNSNVRARLGGATTAGGDVSVLANGKRAADIISVGVSGGIVALGATVTVVNDHGQQVAEVSNSASVNGAGTLSVQAINTQDYDSQVYSVAAGGVGVGVNFALLNLDDGDAGTDETVARIGTNAMIGTTDNVGDVTVAASSTIDARSSVFSAVAGLGAVGVNFSHIFADPQVLAQVDGGARISSNGTVEVASLLDVDLEADVFSITIGAIGVGASISKAEATGSAKAIMSGQILASDSVHVEAKGIAIADAYAEASGGGIVAGNGHDATATASPIIVASLNGSTTSDGLVEVRAISEGRADAITESKAGGIAGVGVGFARANVNPTVTASIGVGKITAANVLVCATHNFEKPSNIWRAYARTEAAGKALAGLQVNRTEAKANAEVRAQIAGSVNIDTEHEASAGFVRIEALSVNTARAFTDGLNVGILAAVGSTQADAQANGTTIAEILDQIAVSATPDYTIGALDVTATGQDTASAQVNAAGGGVLSVDVNEARATATGTVRAEIGRNLGILAGGAVKVTATAKPEVDANTKGVSGGGISVGISEAEATMQPTVTARIDTGTSLSAEGDVGVKASATPQNGLVPTYVIESVNLTANTLRIVSHGLSTGDIVEVGNNPGADERDYNVIVVGEANDTIAFANDFNGLGILPTDADKSGILENRDEIRFARAHNFQNGDRVVLSKLSENASDIESAPGNTFWVVVVDPQTIKLVDSAAKAVPGWFEANASTFLPSGVSGNWIDVGTADYAVGDALTYQAPGGARKFGVATVDVTRAAILDALGDGNPNLALESTSTDNDRIFFVDLVEDSPTEGQFIAHGFSNGDRVVYSSTDPSGVNVGQTLGGLEQGRTYFVANVDIFGN